MEFVVNNLKYTTIKYTENDVEVSIDSANGASGDIVVPSTVTYDGSTYNVVKM